MAITAGNRAFYYNHRTEKCRYRSQQSGYTGKYGRLCTVEKWWEYRTDLRSTGCFIRSDRDQCFKCKKSKRLYLLGIVAATLAGIPLGVTKLSSFDLNLANKFRDFGEVSLFKLDIAGLFEGKSVTEAVFIIIMLVLSFSLVNMFDSRERWMERKTVWSGG